MRRLGLFVSFVVSAGLSGCGSSGGGGTGGNGGAAAQAGASGNGGAGSGSAGTTGSGGAGGSGVACGDATGPSSGQTCNSVTTTGPCVTQTFSTGALPSPAGGAFAAGTYNLTSVTDYVAADAGAQVAGIQRQTFVLSNVTATSLTLDQEVTSGTILYRSSGTVAISGSNAIFTATCPATDGGNQGQPLQFTATSSGFTLLEPEDSGDTRVTVFTKAN